MLFQSLANLTSSNRRCTAAAICRSHPEAHIACHVSAAGHLQQGPLPASYLHERPLALNACLSPCARSKAVCCPGQRPKSALHLPAAHRLNLSASHVCRQQSSLLPAWRLPTRRPAPGGSALAPRGWPSSPRWPPARCRLTTLPAWQTCSASACCPRWRSRQCT